MKWSVILTAVNDKITAVIKVIIAGLLLLFLGILSINVVGRYVFGVSISWAEEITTIAVIWMVYLGAGILSRNGKHLSIEALAEVLPVTLQKILEMFIGIVVSILSLILAYLSIKQVLLMYTSGQIITSAKMPVYLAYLVLPLGFIFMTLGAVEFIAKGGSERIQRRTDVG